MTPETYQRAKRIFSEAIERNAADRAAFVERACAEDRDLRGEVDRLLTRDADPTAALATPILPADALGALLRGDEIRSLPLRVGAFRIVRLIGEGGMGSVYE